MTARAPDAAVNASPLIFLGKLDRLRHLPEPVATTRTVLEEIYSADPSRHTEIDLIQLHVKEERILPMESPENVDLELSGLHEGEASVLALAREQGFRRVFVDDKAAIRAAKLLGLEPMGTPFLLLKACREGEISSEGFKRALDRLLEHRYHLSASLYQALLDNADANA